MSLIVRSALLATLLPTVAFAVTPLSLTHAGYILGTGDNPLTANALPFTFEVYPTATGGSATWTGTCSLDVNGGYYSAQLGSGACAGNGLDTGDVPQGATAYLQVTANGILLTPRLVLNDASGAAVAGRALTADKLGTLAQTDVWARTDDLATALVGGTALSTILAGKVGTSDSRLSDARPVLGLVGTSQGGTGLSSMGAANDLLGMNTAGTGLEYKNLNGAANRIILTKSGGAINISTPQDIGTGSSPTFASPSVTNLTVSNTLTLTSGAPASGKVLTSDAFGNASWQTPAAGGGSSLTTISGTYQFTCGSGWNAFDCYTETQTVNGITTDDTIAWNTASVVPAKFMLSVWISAANTVTFKMCNISSLSGSITNQQMRYRIFKAG